MKINFNYAKKIEILLLHYSKKLLLHLEFSPEYKNIEEKTFCYCGKKGWKYITTIKWTVDEY